MRSEATNIVDNAMSMNLCRLILTHRCLSLRVPQIRKHITVYALLGGAKSKAGLEENLKDNEVGEEEIELFLDGGRGKSKWEAMLLGGKAGGLAAELIEKHGRLREAAAEGDVLLKLIGVGSVNLALLVIDDGLEKLDVGKLKKEAGFKALMKLSVKKKFEEGAGEGGGEEDIEGRRMSTGRGGNVDTLIEKLAKKFPELEEVRLQAEMEEKTRMAEMKERRKRLVENVHLTSHLDGFGESPLLSFLKEKGAEVETGVSVKELRIRVGLIIQDEQEVQAGGGGGAGGGEGEEGDVEEEEEGSGGEEDIGNVVEDEEGEVYNLDEDMEDMEAEEDEEEGIEGEGEEEYHEV